MEAALQSGVLFDVLAVLVKRCGTDGAQFAASQSRFEHVRGIHRALCSACTDQRVQLIEEDDDLALSCSDLVYDRLEPLFELAPVLAARDHTAQIELQNALAMQYGRHIICDYLAGEAFDDGGFAHTGLAYEHRIVFGAP